MMKLNDGRDELWQWDTGRKLTVDADCSEVHFSNRVYGRSVDVPVVDGIAKIPDVLLQMDNDLYAWGFVGTPEDGYTKISKVLHINRRNKPADYVFTPPEQTTLDEILGRINAFEQGEPERITTAIEQYLTDNPITAADVNAVPQNQGVENAGKFMGVNESGEVVPVDAPSGGSGTDIALGISGASAGQIAKIKSVDASGAPTAWEAGDAASGGTELYGNREPDYYYEVAEEISQLYISEINGNPFSANKFACLVEFPAGTGGFYYHALYTVKGSMDKNYCISNHNAPKLSNISTKDSVVFFIVEKLNNQNYKYNYSGQCKTREQKLDGSHGTYTAGIFPNSIEGETSIKSIYLKGENAFGVGVKISIWLD